MQFKHTLGLQDFMNRTENQEQSRAERRKGSERGKRGNEIVARERKGDGGEKRRERENDLRGRPKWKKGEKGTERGSKTSQRMSNGLLKMHCWNACWSIPCQHKIPITHSPLLGSSWAKGRPVSVNPDKEIIKKKDVSESSEWDNQQINFNPKIVHRHSWQWCSEALKTC